MGARILTLALLVVTTIVGLVTTARDVCAAEAPRVTWLTGPDFERQLTQPVTLVWDATPLRTAVTSLSRNQRVAVVLDRRVDPDQAVSLQAQQEPFEPLLARLAQTLHLGETHFGNVVYLGPLDVTAKLRTLQLLQQQAAQRQPVDLRSRVTKIEPWQWGRLSEPRRLIDQLAQQAQLTWPEARAWPHDLWDAGDLPPLAWHDRLLLITAQFDRWATLDATKRELRLEPIPTDVTLERSYAPGKDSAATLERYRTLAPQAKVELVTGKIVVRGRLEDHERIAPPATKQHAAVGKGVEVFSLTLMDVPLSQFFAALEKQLGLSFQYDVEELQQRGITLKDRVSLKIEQQPLDALLTAALDPVKLTFRRNDKRVEVRPK